MTKFIAKNNNKCTHLNPSGEHAQPVEHVRVEGHRRLQKVAVVIGVDLKIYGGNNKMYITNITKYLKCLTKCSFCLNYFKLFRCFTKGGIYRHSPDLRLADRPPQGLAVLQGEKKISMKNQ